MFSKHYTAIPLHADDDKVIMYGRHCLPGWPALPKNHLYLKEAILFFSSLHPKNMQGLLWAAK